MQVQPEYSVVVDFIENNPVIDSRTAQTTLRVQDGHMFVLGGLRQKTITETVRGVPFLKDMKHIGKLFRAHESQVRESELIVFIKPEIVVPCSLGTPREERAKCVSGLRTGSDRARRPYAANPILWKHPNCPNHVRRPRINGGSFDLGPTDAVEGQMVIGDSMPLPNEVIHSIENTNLQTTSSDDNVDPTPVDENTFLRLQQGLRDIEMSNSTIGWQRRAPQPTPVVREIESVQVEIIDDVDPPIHIHRLPSRG